MYNATKWLDKVVDVDSGEVIQAGTDQSAAHFNNMESGITDASVAAAMLLIAAGELQSQTEIERHVVELKNTASYPFNNSAKTVSLAITRETQTTPWTWIFRPTPETSARSRSTTSSSTASRSSTTEAQRAPPLF